MRTLDYAIQVENVAKTFGQVEAVKGVSFKVPAGRIFGLLGPNGSGKSTLIRILCGLMRPTKGTGNVLGFDLANGSESIKLNIGYMSQKFSLYEDLTIRENIEFFGSIYGLSGQQIEQRRSELQEEMHLAGNDHKLVAHLSGGWKQRVALACACVHRPRMLVLDEPTAGVDPVSRRMFWDILAGLAAGGITVLVTTHYMDEAERCDTVALLYSGILWSFGSPGELMRQAGLNSLEDVFIGMVGTGGGEQHVRT